ncbi:MAG TPA: ATP-binding protein [Thermoplasmatales archaeon]|nr:ATP-binding protein [Thermoplasmatales archaeon]
MNNPFIFGKAVTGREFIDRKEEINELKSSLLSGQNVLLFSPRKMGKTSLIMETFRKIDDAICIYIDLWQTTSQYALAREIINRVVEKTYNSVEKLAMDMNHLLKSLKPKVSIDTSGTISVEFSRDEVKRALNEAIDFPERVARKKNKRIIIAFDEFQEIEHLDGLEIEKTFRSTIQHHKMVSYIFAGSKQSLIKTIFGKKERPFYRFAKQIRLFPIDKQIMAKFIVSRFNNTGKKISKDASEWIAEISRGIPYNAQYLCHEVWYMADREIDTNFVKEVFYKKIIPSLDDSFQVMWGSIGSHEQRKLLIGLANEKEPKIYSQSFIEKYDLKTPSHVRKALKSLEENGIIEENRIQDPFFEEWIRSKFLM